MSGLYFIAVPGPGTMGQVQAVGKQTNLATVRSLTIPDLKVGTLDTLMLQSEELQKIDSSVESTVTKMGRTMSDLLTPKHSERLDESFQAGGKTIEAFLNNFTWNVGRYPAKKLTLLAMSELIQREVQKIDEQLKDKLAAFKTAKVSLDQYSRKFTGSLVTRSLIGLVEKHHIVQESDYLTTLLVVVPRGQKSDWDQTYETLVQFVVPKSSVLVHQDDEFCLVTVVLFKRIADEFTVRAREKRFIVRDFTFEEGKSDQTDGERERLEKDVEQKWALLVRWCNVNFSEVYAASAHVKVLRVFVESVLRFSLPIDFTAAIVRPTTKKTDRKFRSALDNMLNTGSSYALSSEDAVGLQQLIGDEYHPYVFVDADALTRESLKFTT